MHNLLKKTQKPKLRVGARSLLLIRGDSHFSETQTLSEEGARFLRSEGATNREETPEKTGPDNKECSHACKVMWRTKVIENNNKITIFEE